MAHNIYLVHEDAELATCLRRAVENGRPVPSINAKKILSRKVSKDDVIVIGAGKDWGKAQQILKEIQKDGQPFYAIISSPAMLKKTITRLQDSPKWQKLNNKDKTASQKSKDNKNEDPCLDELIERKLARFVKKIRQSEGKNLYDLLIQEVEKPLIKLALKETGENQVQASQLLGMHRNTLRKKMKDLKISSIKKHAR